MSNTPEVGPGGGRTVRPSGPPPRPRWVKVLAVVAGVAAVIVLLALVTGGEHGPGRHMSSGVASQSAPASQQ